MKFLTLSKLARASMNTHCLVAGRRKAASDFVRLTTI